MGSQGEIYVLDTCTEADIPQLYDVWQAAFANNRAHSLSFPSHIDPVALQSWYHNRMANLLKKPELRNYKITDTRTGNIVACARWGIPHSKNAEKDVKSDGEKATTTDEIKDGAEPAAKKVEVVGMNSRLFDEVGDTLNRWRERYVKWEDTYGKPISSILSYPPPSETHHRIIPLTSLTVAYLIMTHPNHQRQGLASRLLREALDQADAEGRDAYIEASPDGYPVYVKAGFKEIDRVTFSLEQHGGEAGEEETSVCMVRKPVVKA